MRSEGGSAPANKRAAYVQDTRPDMHGDGRLLALLFGLKEIHLHA